LKYGDADFFRFRALNPLFFRGPQQKLIELQCRREYEGMGEYDKAEPLFQKGLKLFEDKLGPNHYKTGAALDNLGVLYREKGEYKKAESYALRAVDITEKARGPEHPETATCLNDLANLYEAMGDKAKAEPFRQRAAKIREKGKTKPASPQPSP
jgi:tetratricopeptide (TPR) repeat protein